VCGRSQPVGPTAMDMAVDARLRWGTSVSCFRALVSDDLVGGGALVKDAAGDRARAICSSAIERRRCRGGALLANSNLKLMHIGPDR